MPPSSLPRTCLPTTRRRADNQPMTRRFQFTLARLLSAIALFAMWHSACCGSLSTRQKTPSSPSKAFPVALAAAVGYAMTTKVSASLTRTPKKLTPPKLLLQAVGEFAPSPPIVVQEKNASAVAAPWHGILRVNRPCTRGRIGQPRADDPRCSESGQKLTSVAPRSRKGGAFAGGALTAPQCRAVFSAIRRCDEGIAWSSDGRVLAPKPFLLQKCL